MIKEEILASEVRMTRYMSTNCSNANCNNYTPKPSRVIAIATSKGASDIDDLRTGAD